MNGSLFIPKTSNRNKPIHELPRDDDNINAERHSVLKRKTGAFSAEKHPKLLRQGSPGLSWEKEEVPFDHSFNLTVSTLSVSLNRFCFAANMDEDSELNEKALNGKFPESPKKYPLVALKNPKKLAEKVQK